MEQFLRNRGYAHAIVEFVPEGDPNALTAALFKVTEGPKVLMGKVEIEVTGEGANAIPQPELKEFFAFPSEGGLFGGGDVVYRESDVESAMTQVEKSFLSMGYFHVGTAPMKPGFTEDLATANPRVSVQTGQRFGVTITPRDGIPEAVAADLPDFAKLQSEPYTVRLPATIAAGIRRAFLKHGYQLSRVEAVHTAPDKDAASSVPISFEVVPGPVLVLDGIRVEGLDRTDEDFVRSLFDVEPGSALTQKELDRVADRLYTTGLFSRVRIELEPGIDETQDPRPTEVLVALDELEARSFDLELGFGSYELLRGGAHYRDRNAFGAGRVFDATAKASLKSALFELRLTDPYTLGKNNTAFAVLGADTRVEPSFTRQSVYGELSVRHRISDEASITGGYRYRFSNVSDSEVMEVDSDAATSTQAGIYSTLRYDSRDNPLIPEEGLLASAGFFWSTEALLADLNYLETSLQAAVYLRLSEKLETESASTVLALGMEFTTRDPLGSTMKLPIQDRLFLGGESSIRSFGESQLGPFDEDRDPLGGLTSFAAHAEIRQRIVGELFGALFYEFGVINEDSYDLSGPFGHAIGVGLRYYLPVGPARLDFGFNPGEQFASEDNWAVHFSFGFSF
jgi:outer membrane protein assembly factor BamA